MDVDDDNSKKSNDGEIDIIYNMDVDDVTSAIIKQEENVANKKRNILIIAAQNLGYVVPQSIPILFPSSSSSAGAASTSSTPQNMIVDRSDGVKRDNDDDSSKPKKTQRKGGGSSLTKKEKTACSD